MTKRTKTTEEKTMTTKLVKNEWKNIGNIGKENYLLDFVVLATLNDEGSLVVKGHDSDSNHDLTNMVVFKKSHPAHGNKDLLVKLLKNKWNAPDLVLAY